MIDTKKLQHYIYMMEQTYVVLPAYTAYHRNIADIAGWHANGLIDKELRDTLALTNITIAHVAAHVARDTKQEVHQ